MKVILMGILLLLMNSASADEFSEKQARAYIENSTSDWKSHLDESVRHIESENPSLKGSWKELDSLVNEEGAFPIWRLTRAKNENESADFNMWLQHKVLAVAADGRYSYIYAGNLMKASKGGNHDMTQAAVMLVHGRLALHLDSARCNDRIDVANIMIAYESQLKPLSQWLDKQSKLKTAEILLSAASIEEARKTRTPKAWLCRRGLKAMMNAMADEKNVSETTNQSGTIAGKTYAVDTRKVPIEYISDSDWDERRRQIIDGIIQTAVRTASIPVSPPSAP